MDPRCLTPDISPETDRSSLRLAMEQQALEPHSYEDVQKSGYLRKHKSMHRRFFVLRAASEHGPARLEYYENEKKFRSKSPVPKKVLNLETCFNINKRADSKNKHMIVLYTRSESFAIAADSEEVQNEWYQAMLDLQYNCKTPEDYGSSGECSSPSPIPTFKEVWQVKVWPKGLGHARNLVGIYRLCLTDKTVNFVKLNSDVASVVLQLMNVRRCGHSENFFFIEVGRSAITGPGEFWMQVDDSVVAQNMHETLLEAMKALSEEFCQRSKSQSVGTSCGGGTASNPISVPSRRHHPNLPPSQVGFSRRARTETPGTGGSSTSTSPTSRHGFPRARTASIGARSEEGGASARGTWASSSPSLNGSCSTTPTLRPKPTRAPTPAKITLSLARYTPNPAPSPAPSLSSSSGHGSECGLVGAVVGGMSVCSYARVSQRVSVSGSPSDYGSSDEYGSSPGEHSLLIPSLSGHHAHGEGSSSYIVMSQRDSVLGSHHHPKGRRILRRSSSRESEAERRQLSKRASLPLASQERLTPHRKDEDDEDDEEYAVMSRSANRDRLDLHHGSGNPAVRGGQPDVVGKNRKRADKSRREVDTGGAVESGYMSMLPGVTSPPVSLSLSIGMYDSGAKPGADDEYMAMTPNSSVSPPQHIRQPSSEGYMVMSPNSSSSTDLHGLGMWDSRASMENRAASDYMNISPVSSRSACSTPPSHPEQHQLQPKMFNSYFSLPRAYQHTLYTRFEEDLNKGEEKKDSSGPDGAGRGGRVGYSKRNKTPVGSAGGCQLSMSSSSFSSSSASSESLEDKSLSAGRGLSLLRTGAEFKSAGTCTKEGRHQKRGSSSKSPKQHRRGRPQSASSDITKANTLPRVKENLPPGSQTVDEYVSIVFKEEDKYDEGSRRGQPVIHGTLRPLNQPLLCHDNPANLPRSFSAPLSTSAEYVNMDLGKSSTPPTHVRSTFSKARHERGTSSPLAAEHSAGYRAKAKMPADVPASYPDSKGSDPSISARPAIHSGQPLSIEQGTSLVSSPAKSFQSPDRSSRLVRGDQQGHLSHRPETYNSPPSLPRYAPSSTSLFSEGSQAAGRRQGLDCSLWEGGQAAGLSATPPPQASTSSTEQGLNYIDLDLAMKEGPQAGVERTSPVYSVGGGALGSSAGSGPNTYASIDFYKSEELRTNQSSRKDGQDC